MIHFQKSIKSNFFGCRNESRLREETSLFLLTQAQRIAQRTASKAANDPATRAAGTLPAKGTAALEFVERGTEGAVVVPETPVAGATLLEGEREGVEGGETAGVDAGLLEAVTVEAWIMVWVMVWVVVRVEVD